MDRRRKVTREAPPTWKEDRDGMFSLMWDKKRSRGAAFFLLVFAVFWNGVTWAVLLGFLGDQNRSIWMVLFFIPFVLIGLGTAIGALAMFFGGMVSGMRCSPPKVRVSSQPLCLGETFRVEVAQMARKPLNMTGMTVEILGQEWVSYRRGTTTYTDKHVILQRKAEVVPAQQLSPGRPFGGVCSFTIPADAMHSFRASNNRVEWSLKVSTGVKGWLDYRAEFPLRVIPKMVRGT